MQKSATTMAAAPPSCAGVGHSPRMSTCRMAAKTTCIGKKAVTCEAEERRAAQA